MLHANFLRTKTRYLTQCYTVKAVQDEYQYVTGFSISMLQYIMFVDSIVQHNTNTIEELYFSCNMNLNLCLFLVSSLCTVYTPHRFFQSHTLYKYQLET